MYICMRIHTYIPLISSKQRAPSSLFINATKPQFLFLDLSSSVLGHITFTLAKGPNLPNVWHNISSFIYKNIMMILSSGNRHSTDIVICLHYMYVAYSNDSYLWMDVSHIQVSSKGITSIMRSLINIFIF